MVVPQIILRRDGNNKMLRREDDGCCPCFSNKKKGPIKPGDHVSHKHKALADELVHGREPGHDDEHGDILITPSAVSRLDIRTLNNQMRTLVQVCPNCHYEMNEVVYWTQLKPIRQDKNQLPAWVQ